MQNISSVRAIRGAITVDENTKQSINEATIELLNEIIKLNKLDEADIISVIFTLTPDLNAEFPAKSARDVLGWDDIPMICACEVPVPESIQKCIRVMVSFNTQKSRDKIRHVYLRNARNLRPDLAGNQ